MQDLDNSARFCHLLDYTLSSNFISSLPLTDT
nr:MAG TPA: hypothetical protein [Caudoviricetes sp.]